MLQIMPDMLRAGMVLDEDVADGNGVAWLSRGRVLTDADIVAISRFRQERIRIECMGCPVSSSPSDDALMHAQVELDDAFRFAGTKHPMMEELYRLCLHRRACYLTDCWK